MLRAATQRSYYLKLQLSCWEDSVQRWVRTSGELTKVLGIGIGEEMWAGAKKVVGGRDWYLCAQESVDFISLHLPNSSRR